MIVYRLANKAFLPSEEALRSPAKLLKNMNDLAEGARLYGRRWNDTGLPAVYTSVHLSLCALEVLVHLGDAYLIPDYRIIELEVPDHHIISPELPLGWKKDESITKDIFREYVQQGSLALKVPSVIISREHNLVINPQSNLILEIKVRDVYDFEFDQRLLKL
jgi:RES domain-containing protein